VLFLIGLAVVVAGFILPASPLRGWTRLGGFGLLAVSFLIGFGHQRQRRELAFGAYMLAAAVTSGLSDLWPTQPTWLEPIATGVFLLTVGWFVLEVYRFKRDSRPS
jgi:hypothetical protein